MNHSPIPKALAPLRDHALPPLPPANVQPARDARPGATPVVLRTRRFDDLLRWYRTVFGRTAVPTHPAVSFMSFDGSSQRFAFVPLHDTPAPVEPGREVVALPDGARASFTQAPPVEEADPSEAEPEAVPGEGMRWATIDALHHLVPLPAGYHFELLARADVPALIGLLRQWHAAIAVGAGSVYLREAFYDERVTLAGGPRRDTFAVLIRHQGRIVGLWSWDRETEALAIYGRLLVIDPSHRGAGLAGALMRGSEPLARHCGAGFMYVMATLKAPQMAQALEHSGYRLLGFVPGYDRELAADGRVRRVFEAVYARVLVDEADLQWPEPGHLTPGARRLFEQMFQPGRMAR